MLFNLSRQQLLPSLIKKENSSSDMSIDISLKQAEKRVRKAKTKARPELIIDSIYNEWTYYNLHNEFNTSLNTVAQNDRIQRHSIDRITYREFLDFYETQFKPTVLQGISAKWPAARKWTFDEFARRFRNERFKCGEDNKGYNVKLKFKYFLHYMKTNCDDSPLYIFDGQIGEHSRKKELLKDYSVPPFFEEDLFKYVGEDRRPPYRWIVIGSARSGTGIHIDPLGTSAWNALLVGYKRWCLFPTNTPRDLIKLNYVTGGKQFGEAVQWFRLIYPKIQTSLWPREYAPTEILQGPGETVFVPSGWWHVVLNLSDTIAVTQNYVSTNLFPIVWHKTARGRPKLSKKWLEQLKIHRPDLAKMTEIINIHEPTGITSDSSSCSSSSSSSYSSSSSSNRLKCCCSDSNDSGQASLDKKKKRRSRRNDSRSPRR